MIRQIASRLLFGLLSIVGALAIVFTISRVSGDPAVLLSPPGTPLEDIEEYRQQLGLNDPIVRQFGSYSWRLLQGDLGESYYWKKPVRGLLFDRISATVGLALVATVYAVVVGVGFGLWAAFRRGRLVDRGLVSIAMLGQAIPSFWLGPILIILFAVNLGWLPSSGNRSWPSVVLPALALGSFQVAVLFRITRSSAIEALGQDSVRLARSKGSSDVRLAFSHILPNTALPLLTVMGLSLATLIGGSVIVETIFAWPGIGSMMMRAVALRDFPMVQGIAVVFAIAFVVINTVIELLYLVVDPRLRDRQ